MPTKAQLQDELDKARHEAKIWHAIATKNDGVLRMAVNERGVEAGFKCAGLRVLAAEARVMLDLGNAPNFVELTLEDDQGQMLVTVQKREGKTPHQLMTEARSELAEVRAELAEWAERAERYGWT